MLRAAWLFGAGLVVAGLLLLLYFVALLFWQFGTPDSRVLGALLRFVDHSLLQSRLHVAMLLAVLGVALGSLGVLITRRQKHRMSAEEMRTQDRLRRVRQYSDGGRVEPFLGPDVDEGRDDARHRRSA